MVGLIYARAMQLYYHYCHNLAYGTSFHQDHAFFGASYAEMEDDYDALVEYFISIHGNSSFKTSKVSELVHEELEDLDIENMECVEMYQKAIELEKKFQGYLGKINESGSMGLQNAVQGMATKSDVRLYKMRQRVQHASDDE